MKSFYFYASILNDSLASHNYLFFYVLILHMQGVGLKLDDALAFWKAELSQKVSITILISVT